MPIPRFALPLHHIFDIRAQSVQNCYIKYAYSKDPPSNKTVYSEKNICVDNGH